MCQTATIPALFYPATGEIAIFDSDGPRPQFLLDSEKLKVIVAGLEPDQQIPAHAEALAVYHFLAGEGIMTVNDDRFDVCAGDTVIAPAGAARGISATNHLRFLAIKASA